MRLKEIIINFFQDKKNLVIVAIIILIIIAIVFAILSFRKSSQNTSGVFDLKTFKGEIITDNVKIPDTTSISSNVGEIVLRGEYNTELQPKTETKQVFITNAKFTLKEAYNVAVLEVVKWAPDQKLVFIKSNGAIGLDGRSSSWQLVYSSAKKKATYEIIIADNQIVSTKEINSKLTGFDLPSNWYDSYDAIASLRVLPQFSNGTISAISFYYSNAEKSWAYALANDDKTTSMWVK